MTTLADTFDPRSNSIGFIRWALAFAVIFSHAGPVGGFYGGEDLGSPWSNDQSLGGLAVCGFFFMSGFLITKSRLGKASTLRFFWRRALRIFPAWWLTLLVTAFVLAPIGWYRENGTLAGFLQPEADSSLTYFSNNMWLILGQPGAAMVGEGTPFGDRIGYVWNGSAWTLAYEFAAYILVGVLGLAGALRRRWIAAVVSVAIILLSTAQWLSYRGVLSNADVFEDFRILLLFAPFALGILFALFDERIPIDGRLALPAAVLGIAAFLFGGWLLIGQYLFCYGLMWFAIKAKRLQNWDRYGDFSYGIYIIAWPVMFLASVFGLQNRGWFIYHVAVIVVCHAFAFLSWHLIEKPAMSLKNWTPRRFTRSQTMPNKLADDAPMAGKGAVVLETGSAVAVSPAPGSAEKGLEQ